MYKNLCTCLGRSKDVAERNISILPIYGRRSKKLKMKKHTMKPSGSIVVKRFPTKEKPTKKIILKDLLNQISNTLDELSSTSKNISVRNMVTSNPYHEKYDTFSINSSVVTVTSKDLFQRVKRASAKIPVQRTLEQRCCDVIQTEKPKTVIDEQKSKYYIVNKNKPFSYLEPDPDFEIYSKRRQMKKCPRCCLQKDLDLDSGTRRTLSVASITSQDMRKYLKSHIFAKKSRTTLKVQNMCTTNQQTPLLKIELSKNNGKELSKAEEFVCVANALPANQIPIIRDIPKPNPKDKKKEKTVKKNQIRLPPHKDTPALKLDHLTKEELVNAVRYIEEEMKSINVVLKELAEKIVTEEKPEIRCTCEDLKIEPEPECTCGQICPHDYQQPIINFEEDCQCHSVNPEQQPPQTPQVSTVHPKVPTTIADNSKLIYKCGDEYPLNFPKFVLDQSDPSYLEKIINTDKPEKDIFEYQKTVLRDTGNYLETRSAKIQSVLVDGMASSNKFDILANSKLSLDSPIIKLPSYEIVKPLKPPFVSSPILQKYTLKPEECRDLKKLRKLNAAPNAFNIVLENTSEKNIPRIPLLKVKVFDESTKHYVSNILKIEAKMDFKGSVPKIADKKTLKSLDNMTIPWNLLKCYQSMPNVHVKVYEENAINLPKQESLSTIQVKRSNSDGVLMEFQVLDSVLQRYINEIKSIRAKILVKDRKTPKIDNQKPFKLSLTRGLHTGKVFGRDEHEEAPVTLRQVLEQIQKNLGSATKDVLMEKKKQRAQLLLKDPLVNFGTASRMSPEVVASMQDSDVVETIQKDAKKLIAEQLKRKLSDEKPPDQASFQIDVEEKNKTTHGNRRKIEIQTVIDEVPGREDTKKVDMLVTFTPIEEVLCKDGGKMGKTPSPPKKPVDRIPENVSRYFEERMTELCQQRDEILDNLDNKSEKKVKPRVIKIKSSRTTVPKLRYVILKDKNASDYSKATIVNLSSKTEDVEPIDKYLRINKSGKISYVGKKMKMPFFKEEDIVEVPKLVAKKKVQPKNFCNKICCMPAQNVKEVASVNPYPVRFIDDSKEDYPESSNDSLMEFDMTPDTQTLNLLKTLDHKLQETTTEAQSNTQKLINMDMGTILEKLEQYDRIKKNKKQ